MVRRIQALNYRCLRHVDVRLDGNFHILVGPNASGKSTLMDVIGFFADVTGDGIEGAVRKRVPDFRDLVWGRQGNGGRFELAIEVGTEASSADSARNAIRYDLVAGNDRSGPRIDRVQGLAVAPRAPQRRSISRFPEPLAPVSSIAGCNRPEDGVVLFQGPSSRYMDEYQSRFGSVDWEELTEKKLTRELRRELDALNALKAAWEFDAWGSRVRRLLLDGRRLREASQPFQVVGGLSADGSNLPWMVLQLIEKHEDRFRAWLDHVRVVLPELKGVGVVEREDDNRGHLMLAYGAGIEVPSWSVSEGTLRLLALTLVAYLPDEGAVYLIEEPENGIHPLAIEAVYQSLSSAYDSHVFVTTHSPTLLGCASPREVLCFARDQEGATDIVSGADHPRLGEWHRDADMDMLFAPDILG